MKIGHWKAAVFPLLAAAVALMPSACRISLSTGPTLVTASRRLTAASRMAFKVKGFCDESITAIASATLTTPTRSPAFVTDCRSR